MSTPDSGEYGVAVRRREDPPLIKGQGTYTDDVSAPGALHAAFVRSEVAHARVVSIDTQAAADAPGVVAVFTAADLGLDPMPPGQMAPDDMLRPVLAEDRVRFQGEAIAIVVAQTRGQAVDATELVDVELDPLPVVIDPERALDDDATPLFDGRDGATWRSRRPRATPTCSARPTSSSAAATSTSASRPCRWSPARPSRRLTRRPAACASGRPTRARTRCATRSPRR